ncbi:hypothetical protein ASC75_21120 [Aminobacter sp. DSM 101952]|uniref:helix-turn-helix domain-containing protein n=1 Tax=Aminobacter sp. DSM 101952 TaxID=2735891 RepID=UPI0006F69542|nr:helix-turn-helix transcriptional regulator [Aminobacter sp. DSM 101952]KQU74515.1 hypothetical protein ASC75_21120 [Aminobacter sp. DSM 101952]
MREIDMMGARAAEQGREEKSLPTEYRGFVGPFGQVAVSLISRPISHHLHFNYTWMFKVRGPDVELDTPVGPKLIRDDNVLILNPRETHAKSHLTRIPMLALSAHVDSDWLGGVYKEAGIRLGRKFTNTEEPLTQEVRIAAARIVAMLLCYSPTDETHQVELVRDLSLAMGRSYLGGSGSDRASDGSAIDFRVARALRHIDGEKSFSKIGIDKQLANMEELGRQVGLSRSRFFERFRECVGTSPSRYIESVKIAYAMKLLVESDLPIKQIAEELGFSEHTHFTRFFVRRSGMTPSLVRRNQLASEI